MSYMFIIKSQPWQLRPPPDEAGTWCRDMVSFFGILSIICLMNMIRDSFVFEKLGLHIAQPCTILNNAEE